MDQRSNVLYLHLKGLLGHAIHDDLVATLSPKAVAYNMVTPYLHEAQVGTAEVTLGPEPSSPHLDDSDRAILAALEEKKSNFRPCENLPKPPISHTHATVYRRLTKLIGFGRRLPRWVPHLLSDTQKVRCVEL
jgi:hypothetical protein